MAKVQLASGLLLKSEAHLFIPPPSPSSDDDMPDETPAPPKLTPEAAVMPPGPGSSSADDLDMSSITKYLPPEDSDSSDEDTQEATLVNQPQAKGDRGRSSGDNGAGPKYVDLDLPKTEAAGGVKKGKKKQSVEYAVIQQQQQAQGMQGLY